MGRMAGNFIAEEFEYIVSEKNTAGASLQTVVRAGYMHSPACTLHIQQFEELY